MIAAAPVQNEALEEVRTNGEWINDGRDWIISREVYEMVCEALKKAGPPA